jgi:hypothetical protein
MNKNEATSRAIAFLAWLDTFERIDTLILEIRHVQETIVSQLRVEELYAPFRYEDFYFWGTYQNRHGDPGELPTSELQATSPQDWSTALKNLPVLAEGCDVLSKLWCPEFPPRSGEATALQRLRSEKSLAEYRAWFDDEALSRCDGVLGKARRTLNTTNLLHANDEYLYEALRYLQLIKRDILYDKLVLARRALDMFHHNKEDASHGDRFTKYDPIAAFLVVRRGALKGLNLRLEHFSDVVSTVQEILNLSLERDPTPTVWRRRDQGIYTIDLADSCRKIAREVKSFLASVKGMATDPYGYVDHDDELDFIVHRYTRFYTSTVRFDSEQHKRATLVASRNQIRAGFVQSSFWMPERPDLQPIIAHEVAHLLVKQTFNDLSPITLDGMSDPLANLLMQISYICEQYSSRFQFIDFSPLIREQLLRELACDLISVATHRTSFVFAQFLELICFGCEDVFLDSHEEGIAQHPGQFEEDITFVRDRLPDWYLRLMVTAKFAAATVNGELGEHYLEHVALTGVEGLTRRAREQLSFWMDGEQKEDWETWYEMTEVILERLSTCSLIAATGAWNKNNRVNKVVKWEKARAGEMPYSRYVPELDDQIVQSCLGAWIDRLLEPPRMLGSYLRKEFPPPMAVDYCDVIAAFRNLYLNQAQITPFQKTERPEHNLFRYLADIPWQTALLTVHDFLGAELAGDYGVPRERWISGIHEFSWLGRDLYHFALEFVIWNERASMDRLKATNRWLLSTLRTIERNGKVAEHEPLEKLLKTLLYGSANVPDDRIPNRIEESSKRLAEIMRDFVKGWPREDVVHKWPALIAETGSVAICSTSPQNNPQEGISGINKQKMFDQYNHLASSKMDSARAQIDEALKKFVAQHSALIEAGNLPKSAMEVVLQLIKIMHYLSVRPSTVPHDIPVKRADSDTNSWSTVFCRYLDVPIQARKVKSVAGNETIKHLVPTRSVRIDRFSLSYESESFESNTPASPGQNNSGPDTLILGRPLYWHPWRADGVRERANQTMFRTTLTTALLGRFDRVSLSVAKHTRRIGPETPTVPFFRRQQVGFPFGADIAGDKVVSIPSSFPFPTSLSLEQSRDPDRQIRSAPLATINILLTQRSVRLTFVERLIAENLLARSYHKKLLSNYRFFRPDRDIGLLTDGWGDMFLVLFHELRQRGEITFDKYVEACEKVRRRLADIILLRQELFEDTLVVRTETSYTPLAVDGALLDPKTYETTISIRLRPTLDGTLLCERFEKHMNDVLSRSLVDDGVTPQISLSQIFRFSRVPGRTDYHIVTETAEPGLAEKIYQHLCGNKPPYSPGIIFGNLRERFFHDIDGFPEHIDSTSTLIGEVFHQKKRNS